MFYYKKIEKWAKENNLTYTKSEFCHYPTILDENVVRGTYKGINLYIYDIRRSGAGRSGTGTWHTVININGKNVFPRFMIYPNNSEVLYLFFGTYLTVKQIENIISEYIQTGKVDFKKYSNIWKTILWIIAFVIFLVLLVCISYPNQTQLKKADDVNQLAKLKADYFQLVTRYDLKYKTYPEAVVAMQQNLGFNEILPQSISFHVPGKVPREDGDPYFIGFGVINEKENKCVKGYFDLITGAGAAVEDVCVIMN